MIEVLDPGFLTTCQDGGRPGHAHQGIGASGAADQAALALANALVGNEHKACVLECALRGPALRLRRPAWIALVGAPMPQARCNGEPLRMWGPCRIPEGATLELGGMARGCRAWLAVDGGIRVPSWLASRSSDVANGLGPPPLQAGNVLPLGTPLAEPLEQGWWLDGSAWFRPADDTPLRLIPARQTDALDAASREAVAAGRFRVAADSNRTGVRLDGPRLACNGRLDAPSCGVITGAVQLPPGGKPIILGCEHPVTGGYPRIAQMIEADWPRLAQLRPGDRVRFAWVAIEDADQAHALAQHALRDTLTRIAARRAGNLPS